MSKHIIQPVRTAVDLGCGPGFGTEMLSGLLDQADVYGLERSDEFLQMARESYPSCSFIKHDVTSGPLPIKAEVAYCRFLLSHLKDIEILINMWVRSLAPGGMLFIDELEDISTNIPVFRRYLEINDNLVRSQGAELFVGKELSKCALGAATISNEVHVIPVATWRAASWFYPNTVTIWENEKFVRDNYAGKRQGRDIQRDSLKNGIKRFER